jgi:predicted DNA-binding transcriptional regulator YafY
MLKQYNKRWFLISWNDEKQRIWVTALDRVEQIEIVNDITYFKNTIDLEEYFDDVLGVTKYKDEVLKKIRLKVYKKSIAYIRTKPLHHSQRKIELTDDYMIIELRLLWNYELESLILSYGNNVEVLAPQDFREKIAERIRTAKSLYD